MIYLCNVCFNKLYKLILCFRLELMLKYIIFSTPKEPPVKCIVFFQKKGTGISFIISLSVKAKSFLFIFF